MGCFCTTLALLPHEWTGPFGTIESLPIFGLMVALVTGLAAGRLYILSKGASLAAATRAKGPRWNQPAAARTFAEGVAVEAITWPGKVVADGYRTMWVPERTWPRRVAWIARWRGAGLLATLMAALVLSLSLHWSLGKAWVGVALGIMAPFLAVGFLTLDRSARRNRLTARENWRHFGFSAWWHLAALAVDVSAFVVAASLLADTAPATAIPLALATGWAAALIPVPLGFGVAELGLTAGLVALGAGWGEAGLAVAIYRITGPGQTLLTGLFGLTRRGIKGSLRRWPRSLEVGLQLSDSSRSEAARLKPI